MDRQPGRPAPHAVAASSYHSLVHVTAVLRCLEEVAAERATGPAHGGSLLSRTLGRLGMTDAEADAICQLGVKELYNQRRLPLNPTLGAAVVLHIVQRCEGMGQPDSSVVASAGRLGARILGLPTVAEPPGGPRSVAA